MHHHVVIRNLNLVDIAVLVAEPFDSRLNARSLLALANLSNQRGLHGIHRVLMPKPVCFLKCIKELTSSRGQLVAGRVQSLRHAFTSLDVHAGKDTAQLISDASIRRHAASVALSNLTIKGEVQAPAVSLHTLTRPDVVKRELVERVGGTVIRSLFEGAAARRGIVIHPANHSRAKVNRIEVRLPVSSHIRLVSA